MQSLERCFAPCQPPICTSYLPISDSHPQIQKPGLPGILATALLRLRGRGDRKSPSPRLLKSLKRPSTPCSGIGPPVLAMNCSHSQNDMSASAEALGDAIQIDQSQIDMGRSAEALGDAPKLASRGPSKQGCSAGGWLGTVAPLLQAPEACCCALGRLAQTSTWQICCASVIAGTLTLCCCHGMTCCWAPQLLAPQQA